MLHLLIATKNPGKFHEISKFLKIPTVKLYSLRDFPVVREPAETGKTFQENALIKAEYYSKKFKMATIADDGGLEIEVFHGEPGIKSRRWIDGVHEATDDELINYCLVKMKDIKNRRAKLTACLCLYIPEKIIYAEESIGGVIAEKPAKNVFPGFPFRSLLWIPSLKKFYNEDEFTESETKKYNHRYKAIQKIKNFLNKNYAFS